MRVENWARYSEIVGAIAIVASLVFVGLQINQNTKVAKSNSYQNLLEQVASWRSQIVTSPDLTRLFDAYNRGETDTLTDLEEARITMHETTYFGVVETAYFSRSYGVIGKSEWQRLSDAACIHMKRLRANYGNDAAPSFMTEEFLDYLRENC